MLSKAPNSLTAAPKLEVEWRKGLHYAGGGGHSILDSSSLDSKLFFGIICGTLRKLLDFTDPQFSYLYCESTENNNLRGLLIWSSEMIFGKCLARCLAHSKLPRNLSVITSCYVFHNTLLQPFSKWDPQTFSGVIRSIYFHNTKNLFFHCFNICFDGSKSKSLQTTRNHFTPTKSAIVKKTGNNTFWWVCEETETFVHCW